MRIGIDYTAAVRQRAGIGRYVRNLVRTLATLDAENRYTLLMAGGWQEGDGLGPWPSNFRVRSIPFSDRLLHIVWQRLRIPLPVKLVTGPLEVFHSPDFVLPPTGRTPAILTVHDLSFLRVPQCFVAGFVAYLEAAVGRAVKRARRILADSQSTRRDLIELMNVEPERVVVLYPGVEPRFQKIRDPGALAIVQQRYNLPDRFVLGLGTLQPRKNFVGLLRAFQHLLASSGGSPGSTELHLVIVGGKGWMAEELFTAVRDTGLGERVQITGFVEDGDLPALYNLAAVFAFPSWYEGFGLPVLEAMACGTPVVSADNSSLPEVVGDAGIMVPAGEVPALARAVERLLTDSDLRERLVMSGYAQAAKFTWNAAAEQLLALYRSFG